MLMKFSKYSLVFLIILMSISYSQSMQDLKKMKEEYDKMRKGQNSGLPFPSQSVNQPQSDPLSGNPSTATLGYNQAYFQNKDSLNNSLKHFGYDFFIKRDSVSFWENLPTPKNYLLGPGDELILSLWGETQLRQSYTINREGNIYDDKVGLLSMVGKTIEEGEKYLKINFGNVYSTLKGKDPSTYIDLSLGKLRSINVNFVGEVTFPGVYPIHPFSTLITGLIQAGGIDTTGSLRNITVKRGNNKKDVNFDLYEYLFNGNNKNNIQLRDQDIVLVPFKKSTITIDSAISRPAIYEFVKGESIKELIEYAGGLKPSASSVLSLQRIIPIEKRKNNQSIYKNIYIDFDSSQLSLAQSGDYIIAKNINMTPFKVELIGREKFPNKFNFFEGMTLYDLFDISGILDQNLNYFDMVFSDEAEISRRNPQNSFEEIIRININNFISNPSKAKEFNLQNQDRIILHPNKNFIEKELITIEGEVNKPGLYTLSKAQENLKSLLLRAGGLTDNALPDGISIYRQKKHNYQLNINYADIYAYQNNDKNDQTAANQINFISENRLFKGDENRVRLAWQNENVILMPGDSILVKEKTNTVNVLGEVYNPGLQEFQQNESLRYYINSAGGITDKGSKNRIIVIYANGSVSPKKWYSSPKIRDGATIIINQDKLSVPFNITQFATNWTSILSSLITAVILSQQISS